MGTVNELLGIARKQIGVSEAPPDSNNVRYNTWYYGREVMGSWYPWCMVFCQWVFDQAGVKLPQRTASCGDLMNAAKAAGCWVARDFQPGDVVIYDFSGRQKTTQHCGIVEQALPDYGVQAIEGNTSQGGGSQDNGGMVCRKTRPLSQVVGAVRPNYQKEDKRMDNIPSPAHKEGVDWAKKNGILTGDAAGDLKLSQPVTRQQLCSMLYRLAKSMGKA